MRTIMKSALERMLNAEMDVHLGRRPLAPATDIPPAIPTEPAGRKNRRNGRSPKTVGGDPGELTLEAPRDRDGTFEPQLIPEHQRRTPGSTTRSWRRTRRG